MPPPYEDLEATFHKAVWLIRNGPPAASSNDKKLAFYKYYKQATEGNVKGDRPGMLSFEARAKWDAWASVRDMPMEEAMEHYIALLEADDVAWEEHPALASYTPALVQ